jgi:hypothetical protein
MLITPQIICDILQTCMTLESDQIWITNTRRSIPEDKRLYVVVGTMGFTPYGSTNRHEFNGSVMQETLSSWVQETITVDILSYTTEAVERYWEVMASIKSSYSQNLQQTHCIKISEIPTTVNDASEAEGPALIYRIAITLQVLRKYDKIMDVEYYDNFYAPWVSQIEQQ